MNDRAPSKLIFPLGLSFGAGGAALGLCTTLERVLHHAQAYPVASAVALHACVAALASGLAGLSVGLGIDLVDRGLLGTSGRRRAALCCAAFAAGAAGYRQIVAPSRYGRELPELPAALGSGTLLALSAWFALRFVVPWLARHLTIARAALLLALVALEWVDLHQYVRSYGNVHLVSSSVAVIGAGIWVSLLPGRIGRPWSWLALSFGLFAIGAAVTPSTHAARAAVLGLGAAEKLLLQHVLWPLMDGDGDGAAAGLFRTDCDDEDPDSAPLRLPARSPSLGCVTLPVPAAAPRPVPRALTPTRDLVWIIVDAWRTDTPAVLPPWTRSFTRLTGYRSCGSRTEQVVTQLIGDAGCPKALSGGSLARWLTDGGYELIHMGEYKAVSAQFSPATLFGSRAALLDRARNVLAGHDSTRPRFALVHFKGGHADYDGTGATPRARYDDAIAKTLDAVGEIVSGLPPSAVVVVAGDHGEEFGEHDASTHALSLYEEVLRTPVLVRAPSLHAGSDARALGCPELVELVSGALADAPSLALGVAPSFAMLASPRGVHGGLSESVSFAMVSGDQLKVIWQPLLDVWELYDLRRDPAEKHNLADAQPGLLGTMAQRLLAAIQTCGGGFR